VKTDDKTLHFDDQPKSDDTFELSDDPVFNFDLLEPEDTLASKEEVAEISGTVRAMECLCPKCSETTPIDLSEMPSDGFVAHCSTCNATLHVLRESCACRAKRQSHEICCANCGSRLDQHVHCKSCGLIYPDYLILVNLDDARRKARKDFISKKWTAIRDFEFSFRPVRSGSSIDTTHHYVPQKSASGETAAKSLFTRKFATISLGLIVTVALVATGVFAYNLHQREKQYARNYFKAIYGIKTGVDTNLKTCSTMKAEWEKAANSGIRYSPLISTNDEMKSAKLRGEVDKIVNLTNEPPKKLASSKDRLQAIYKIYLESDALINSKPNSLQEFSNTIDKLDKKMKLASNDIKSNLPDSMKEEMQNAKLKYRGLSDF